MVSELLLSVARGERTADLVLKNAKVVNVFSGEIMDTNIAIHDGYIAGLGNYRGSTEHDLKGRYVTPGFIDGHIHIESSMLLPHHFGRVVIGWGTTTVVTDPHEIANVLGVDGIRLMQASADLGPLEVNFMVPSCVPATDMETSGAALDADDIKMLLKEVTNIGLAEMMNFPAVIKGEADVLEKIRAASGMVIDGHAPGVTGKALNAYVASGILSDHECITPEEAKEKLGTGMYVMIREGSTAKNLEDLLPAINCYNSNRFILVTDDIHPDDLLSGHLNIILKKAVKLGLDPVTAIRMVTLNPACYFGLPKLGALAPGYKADIVVLNDLSEFITVAVYKKGELVAQDGRPIRAWPREMFPAMTSMNVSITEKPFRIVARDEMAKVIEVIPGQLVTKKVLLAPKIENGLVVCDIKNDILKVAVVERHKGTGNVGLGLVRGFGLRQGALASSVAHDSHNIIVIGTNDRDMEKALWEIINTGGGIAVVANEELIAGMPLSVAGLMSDQDIKAVAVQLGKLKQAANNLGCKLSEPFMAMSFLSLPVIPNLKITDKGLVDVDKYKFTPLFGEE